MKIRIFRAKLCEKNWVMAKEIDLIQSRFGAIYKNTDVQQSITFLILSPVKPTE